MRPSTIMTATLLFAALFLVFGSFLTEVGNNYGVNAGSPNDAIYANVSELTGQAQVIGQNAQGGNASLLNSAVATVDTAYATATLPFTTIGVIYNMVTNFWTMMSLDARIALILISTLIIGLAITLISAIVRYVL